MRFDSDREHGDQEDTGQDDDVEWRNWHMDDPELILVMNGTGTMVPSLQAICPTTDNSEARFNDLGSKYEHGPAVTLELAIMCAKENGDNALREANVGEVVVVIKCLNQKPERMAV